MRRRIKLKERILKHLLIVFLCIPLLSASAYSSLEALLADMNRKEVEALREYIAANPQAEDVETARQYLLSGLFNQEDYEGALAIVQSIYDGWADKTQIETEQIGEVVMPLLGIYQALGKEEEAKAFAEKVIEDFRDHEDAELIKQALESTMSTGNAPTVGEALNISFTSTDGREVDLSSMTGKVVLVDFWATWCGPCIRAMPEIKKLYEDFQSRGFEIIGISLDNERDALDAYLEKEGITWPQYFDGKGWENEWAVEYGIQSIPSTFLIGTDGKVVAVDAGADELRSMIESLLPAP